jgi:putative iron-regulated protein
MVALNQAQDEADVTTGWHAIEFLLWGQDLSVDGPGNRPVSDFIAGQGNNDRRREYLANLSKHLTGLLGGLVDDWATDGSSAYVQSLRRDEPREVVGRMMNGIAILAGYEVMSERLAVALDSGDQEDEHSCFSDTTKQDFVYDVAGIRQVWTGDSDCAQRAGLDELVRTIDPAVADEVEAALTDAEAKADALGDPWDQVLASDEGSAQRQDAEAFVTSLQTLGAVLSKAGAKLGVLVLIPS